MSESDWFGWTRRLHAGLVCVLVAVAALLLCAPGARASAGDFSPGPGSPYVTGSGDQPTSVAVADFNGDGRDDTATVSSSVSTSVTILLADGSGGFTEPATSPEFAGGDASSVAVGDFNRDGKPDLVVTTAPGDAAGGVALFRGTGDGDFDLTGVRSIGDRPVAVAVGDFGGDGDDDVVTANAGSNTVTVASGDGAGGLQFPPSTMAVGVEPSSLAVGDFDRDGKQDLATANVGSDDVTILRGGGTDNFPFVFGATTTAGIGTGAVDPRSVAVADFNRDGRQDLVTANEGSGDMSVLLGDGTGAFTATRRALSASPSAVAVGDFNADGREDLATANAASDDVAVLFGDGAGGFAAAATSPEPVGDGPVAIAVGDFDWDGKDDLATANRASPTTNGTVSILINQTPSRAGVNFAPAPTGPEPLTGSGPHDVVVGDFDRDGKRDLATANAFSNNVTVLLGQGTGDFVAHSQGVGGPPYSIATGDFNRDGKQDLVTANRSANTLTILLGVGDGTFTASSHTNGTLLPAAVEVGDLNRDGAEDLVFTSGHGHPDIGTVGVSLGNGAGGFTAAPFNSVGAGPESIHVGDFNRDGALDLAVAGMLANNVEVERGNGSGAFPAASFIIGTGTEPASIAGGDFNRDGRQDLVTANRGSANLSHLRGQGDGNFTALGPIPAGGTAPSGVAVGDFDDDGNPDLASANAGSNTVSVLTGNGAGSFTRAATSPETTGAAPVSVAVADFNGDGRQDLVSANRDSNNVTVLLADDPTVAVDDAATVAEDSGATTVDVRANDTDPDSAAEKIASVDAGPDAHGTVAITNGGNDLSYTPAQDYCGAASFTYTLSEGDTATVSNTVTCVADRTDAVDDARTVGEDSGATTIDVRANDTDPDADPKEKIASRATGPDTHGTVAITNGGDDLTYTPDPNYCGTATFTYTLTGGDTATVSVSVSCVNDAADAVDDTATIGEDAGPTTLDVRANDTDVEAEKDTIASLASSGARGTVAITSGGADLTYTPDPDYCGSASFTYTLTGGDTATVTVDVTCVADATRAIDDTVTVQEDSTTTIDVRANDTDPDSAKEKIVFIEFSPSKHGTVQITNGGDDLTYTPNQNYCGPANFEYALAGGDFAMVSINVACVDDPTSATNDGFIIDEDPPPPTCVPSPNACWYGVRLNDTDPDGTREKIASISTSSATRGTVTIVGDGIDIDYRPDPNYCNAGPPNDSEPDATFTYTLTSGSTATVRFRVNCVADRTDAVDDSLTVAEDSGATTIDARANDTDPDSAKEKIESLGTTSATHGSVAIANGGDDLRFTPDPDYCGPAVLTYTLVGGDTATVSADVTCVDDAPVAVDDQVTVDAGSGAAAIEVLDNDTDIDAGPKQVASVTQPSNGTASASDGGARVSYTPAAGYCNSLEGGAPERFTYKLEGGSEATVAVRVRCRALAPPGAPGGPSGPTGPAGPGPSTDPVAPRLAAGQRRARLVRGRVGIRLSCLGTTGQVCAGTLTLKPSSSKRRAAAAAAGRARFSIVAGRSQTVRVQPTKALRALLRKRRKAVASLRATMRGDGAASTPLEQRITILLRR